DMSRRLTKEDFIKRAKEKHGDKYNYDLIEYKNNNTKVKIVCKEHDVFEQSPANHIKNINPQGCPICRYKKSGSSVTKFYLKKKFNDLIQPEDYKLVPLSKGKFAKVDNDDFDRIKDINWNFDSDNYAVNTKLGLMHRYIM